MHMEKNKLQHVHIKKKTQSIQRQQIYMKAHQNKGELLTTNEREKREEAQTDCCQTKTEILETKPKPMNLNPKSKSKKVQV